MVNVKSLLPELKKLVTDLSEDMLKRVNDNTEINDGLKHAYQQIEKGGRTAQAYEVWLEDYLDQVAVAWVLSCVFIRFMEDNGLIDECYLAGEGVRRTKAENEHELYFRGHPHDSDREYFEHVFREVGMIPACHDLFAEGKTPLWAVGPSGDAAMKLLGFWREIDAEGGELRRLFDVEDSDTRFLGDLYQDLSERARKRYALLQTPVFVEEFILDRTLNPAIDEFGLDEVRLIDPTCGSGHFLLGTFARLFNLWIKREDNEIVAAQKALDGVWGVDINPFAVAVARFRLIVVALRACGITRLKGAPAWNIHLATGDSLLFGGRWDRDGKKKGVQQFLGTEEESWAPEIYACEDKDALNEVLGQQYHAIVGNPPYIVMRDKRLNSAYRDRFQSCHRQYSLGVPFTERFFDLALSENGNTGYVGMITANSFMKREFGKKLIESFFPKVELTCVVDASGAYIPGHGTPTVLLFGRNRKPTTNTVRAVLGIRGEPDTPDDPADGQVWQSIISQIDSAHAEDEFTSTADVPRESFCSHPWSLEGGGARQVQAFLESATTRLLKDEVASIGFYQDTHADEAFVQPNDFVARTGLQAAFRPQMRGEEIRDWEADSEEQILFPYDDRLQQWPSIPRSPNWAWLYRLRTTLWNRSTFGGGTYRTSSRPWFDYHQFPKDRARAAQLIAFAFVASHNHFYLVSDGRILNRSAPVIKLIDDASEKDHLALLGYLNSSTAGFWMKQVSHQKQLTGGDGVRVESRAKVPYEFAGTQLAGLPIPHSLVNGELRDRLIRLASLLRKLGQQTESLCADTAIDDGLSAGHKRIAELFDEYESKRSKIRSEMVFLQEELDFSVYVAFGMCDKSLLCDEWDWTTVAFNAGLRPFEILQKRNLDGFTSETAVPDSWPEALRDLWLERIGAIENSKEVATIENDHYKRRWIGRQGLFNLTARTNELRAACCGWLRRRMESGEVWGNTEQLMSISELAQFMANDREFIEVATLYRERQDFDMSGVVAELVEAESVPILPCLVFKAPGLRKYGAWTKVWEVQRKEDAGKTTEEPMAPPKFSAADFIKSDFSRLRGKLNIPKERFFSLPHCERDGDPSLVVGWAGWDFVQQATAIVAYYDARKREGWTAERLTPLLAGLDQLLPWIHQWHPEIDPEYNETAGTSFQTLLESEAQELGLTLEDIRNWTPPKKKKGGRRKAKR